MPSENAAFASDNASAANLKFLSEPQQVLLGNFKFKAALEDHYLPEPL